MTSLASNFVLVLGNVIYVALIVRVILSWLNVGTTNPLVALVHQITEPILAPIRRMLPSFGMMDFSPMVAMFLVFLVQRLFLSFLR